MKGSKKICLFQSFKTSLLLFLLLLSWVFVAFVVVAVAVIVDIGYCCCYCCCCLPVPVSSPSCPHPLLPLLPPPPPPPSVPPPPPSFPPPPPLLPPPLGPWHMIGYRQTAMGTWKKVGQTCDWRSCHLVKEHGWSGSADWVYMNEFSLPFRTVTGYRRRTVYQWTTDTYLLCCRGWQRRGDSCPIG